MTERVRKLYDYIITEKKHHQFRQAPVDPYMLAREFTSKDMPDVDRAAQRLIYVLDHETPVMLDERADHIEREPYAHYT